MKRDSSSQGFSGLMEGRMFLFTRGARSGFTLLEMCVVLLIIALLFGVSMPAISSAFNEQAVRKDSHQLALMVKTAMLRSVEQHRAYVIDLTEKSMALHPLGTIAVDADADADDSAPPANGPVDISVTTNLDSPNKLMVPDPKKADTWMAMPDTEWTFAPGELCQVGKVRVTRGDAYIELSFNALTGNVENEGSSIP